jgi:nucleoside 2-deoxyribosyltransferase
MTLRRIYIAGKFESAARLRDEREAIEAESNGQVVSTWLDEEEESATSGMKLSYARRDYHQIARADLLILDTLDENPRGGREVEYGIALARGIEVWIVGPKRNVFHEMAPNFDSWNEVHETLSSDWWHAAEEEEEEEEVDA